MGEACEFELAGLMDEGQKKLAGYARYRGLAVVVATSDLATLPFEAIDPSLLVVAVERSKDGEFTSSIALRSGGLGEPLDLPSVDILVATAASNEGLALLQSLSTSSYAGVLKDTEIVVLPTVRNNSLEFATAVQKGCALFFQRLSERNSALARSLAVLRRELETTQDAFGALEEIVSTLRLGERLVFATEPATDGFIALNEKVVQRLPVASRALSAFELSFRGEQSGAQGTCIVELATIEDGRVAGTWSLPFERIKPGWIRFELSRGVAGQPQTVEIQVSAHSQMGHVPSIFTAPASVTAESAYSALSGTRFGAPLAIRVWYGSPGKSTRRLVEGVVIEGETTSTLIQRLGPIQLANVHAFGKGAESAQKLVQYIADSEEIQVHPRPRAIVHALIPQSVPVGTKCVSSQIMTRHNKGPSIDYAMLIVPRRRWLGFSVLKIMNMASLGSAQGFSGWTTVLADYGTQIQVLLDKPLSETCDLILMTRPTDMKRGNTDYAWARFFNIEVQVNR